MDKVKGHRGFGAEYGSGYGELNGELIEIGYGHGSFGYLTGYGYGYGEGSLGGGSGNDVCGYGFGNIPGAGTLSGDGSEKHIDVH